MGSCLVTKLKDVVNNDNLKKFGHIVLNCKSEGNKYFLISLKPNAEPIAITMLEGSIDRVQGGTIIDPTHAIIDGNHGFPGIFTTEASQNIKIDFEDYYSLAGLGKIVSDDNVKDLKYTDVKTIMIYPEAESKFNVSVLKDLVNVNILELTLLYEQGNRLIGDLSFLTNFSALTSLTLFGVSVDYTDLIFSPSYISNLVNLTEVKLDANKLYSFASDTIANFYGNLINLQKLRLQGTLSKGTVEDFVAAQIAAGRATCSGIAIGANMGRDVTFQGSAITGDNAKILSWTSVNDITIV